MAALLLAPFAGVAGAEPAPFAAPFVRAPLDSEMVVTSGFGDFRSNHFHAGLDFSTGGRVGAPVYAPLPGFVRRVRASGVGYGRSLYLESDDGRLLVFGHLDAVAGPLAAYVQTAQDSSSQYEQDLWPEPGRFRVGAGDLIAWTGESGGGGPHLHLEVRRGDMALHPLRAGMVLSDTVPPRLVRLTLVPLDDTSSVAGGKGPAALELGGRDTVRVGAWGRLRAVVEAVDALSASWRSVAPWVVRCDDGGDFVECRFDSVSWATDMPEADYVYDRGRAGTRGTRSLVLWAPSGFRPRVTNATAAPDAEAGTLRVGGEARAVRLTAADLAGNRAQAWLVLEPLRPARPDSSAIGDRGGAGDDGSRPERGAVADTAGWDGRESPHAGVAPAPSRVWLGPRAAGAVLGRAGECRVVFPGRAVFDSAQVSLEVAVAGGRCGGLVPASRVYAVVPALTPLRLPIEIEIAAGPGSAATGVALYRDAGGEWEFLSAGFDSARRSLAGSTRRAGRFALFRDRTPPRIHLRRPLRRAPAGPYSRWALEARLAEAGSGVEARRSFLRVDGRRVPSEWDAEARVLRWRPLRAPAAGHHAVEVVAVDRVGNTARSSGSFVLD